jgi:hypothetical protein
MIYGRSQFHGEVYDAPHQRDVQEIQKLTEAHIKIRFLYLARAPVFTRDTIVDVAEQLKNLSGK